MPNHRRSDDLDDMHGHRLQAAVDSTTTKAWARWVYPIVAATAAFLLNDKLNTIDHNQGTSAARTEAIAADVAITKADMRVLKATIDAGVIRQIGEIEDRVDKLEDRTTVLERTVQTP